MGLLIWVWRFRFGDVVEGEDDGGGGLVTGRGEGCGLG